ncbi:DUF1295 domain-containing protein [Reinekea blandensis]|uniref:Uncharacterized protein n=1 Tax=Reinekea blandensis MED297 TaxID=314283 RepID=A4BE76_9GAMM|nr:DUF1295 domain-containing protein [Reinekea blandensis]EAR09554.1 hypothetical protein MED297_12522 [Reinekea blandensis MED297]
MKLAKSVLINVVVWLIALGLAMALGGQAIKLGSFNSVLLLMVMAFVIQWVMFIPAYLKQSERYFDLTGSLTYIAMVVGAWAVQGNPSVVQWLVGILVVAWAVRLGSYLFARMLRDGKDGRFDEIKPNPIRFFTVWNLQGLWVSVTTAAAIVVLTTSSTVTFSVWTAVGLTLWVVGFAIEVIGDEQKRRFKRQAENKGTFIQQGLWARSRHPNYFGEIVLWLGIAVLSLPALSGWQFMALVSPIFVILLLTRISGVPMLEKRADERWGSQPDYREYKARTPVLVPSLWPTEKAQSIKAESGQ